MARPFQKFRKFYTPHSDSSFTASDIGMSFNIKPYHHDVNHQLRKMSEKRENDIPRKGIPKERPRSRSKSINRKSPRADSLEKFSGVKLVAPEVMR